MFSKAFCFCFSYNYFFMIYLFQYVSACWLNSLLKNLLINVFTGSFALIAVLPTYRYFHKRRRVSKTDSNGSKESNSEELHDEDFEFLAIQMAYLCVFSRTLALVNAGNNVLYFMFDNNEKSFELVVRIHLKLVMFVFSEDL